MTPWRLPDPTPLDHGGRASLSPLGLAAIAAEVSARRAAIERALREQGIPARVREVTQGPIVSRYGLKLGLITKKIRGRPVHFRVRVNRVTALRDDLALALQASSVRVDPIPRRGLVGIEVPNEEKAIVSLGAVMGSPQFRRVNSRLALALGIDVAGRALAHDLATMPHLLIAGTTGSGKSTCVNALLACLLCGNTPDDLRLLLIDPKRVELGTYNGIPHLQMPVLSDMDQIMAALRWAVSEMDRRYAAFAVAGVRSLEQYNVWAQRHGQAGCPRLAVVVDEFADLMMVAPNEVERSVCRIAQIGRAAGVHAILATQRPSVDVVTGLIKANFPARISFQVSAGVDSRVILDALGAEQLLGRGDMLFMAPDASKLVRAQGCYVADEELGRIVEHWREQATEAPAAPVVDVDAPKAEQSDPLLEEAIAIARAEGRASVSYLQRRLRVGYVRAARIMDEMQARGIVGPVAGVTSGRVVMPERETS